MDACIDAAKFVDDPARCYAALGQPAPARLDPVDSALLVLQRAQLILDADNAPAVGARDLNVLRSLLALVFRDGPTRSDHVATLFSSLLFPRGVLSQTLIATTILDRHVPDLLRASMAFAWLPKSQSPQGGLSLLSLRPLVLRLLESLPLSQVMSDLGAVLSSTPPPPPHVRRICSSLLTKSLLRPGGVRALFAAVFGEQGSDDPQLEKYEHTASILVTIPAALNPQEYFAIIIPPLMESLSDSVPASHKRAAAFSISRMLDPAFVHRPLVSSLVLTIIHTPIITLSRENRQGPQSTPTAAFSMLINLLLYTDPSPIFITYVLSPVVPAIYALLFHLDTTKASDPVLKESVKGLLSTWGRVVESQDGTNTLWSIIQADRIYWQVDISGNIEHCVSPTTKPVLPTSVEGDEVMGLNLFNLYPDPAHFVQYIKSLHRPDLASELFVRLLEAYHFVDTEQDADPSRGLLYLQMIAQMQTQLSDDSSSTNILRKPEHILSFIKHALESVPLAPQKVEHSRDLGLEDLRIVDGTEDLGDSDSDDEPIEAESSMTGTAINLLLAILEANLDLSARNAPVLNDIFSLLEPFTNDASESIKRLAREARMVMTARLASSSTPWPAPQRKDEESPQEIYQKALKLLQDPILPVRAHGLLLLRQLVSSRPRASAPTTDAALVPAILSIFMQAVQDDDSYIFLNAVQGLSAMVDAFGREVLGNLLETYTCNLSASSVGMLSKQEVDSKVRVGEALGQVIRRCGDTLGVHADVIVPRLISVFRSSYAPTVLRTSAVSLLTQCVKTSIISVLRYINDLAAGMIDVLQVEMVPVTRSPPKNDVGEAREVEGHGRADVLDSKPTAVDPKLPPLRRAALHFWTTLFNQLTHAAYDGVTVDGLPNNLLKRAKVTLGYIASTDEDGIVRVMAREAIESIDQLNKAKLGI